MRARIVLIVLAMTSGVVWITAPPVRAASALRRAPAAPSVTITALVIGGFDQKAYTVPAGKVTIHFRGATGLTLGFADRRFRMCLLTTDSGGPHTCQVTLTPGGYRIYDTIAGHRAAGYEATIVVPKPGH